MCLIRRRHILRRVGAHQTDMFQNRFRAGRVSVNLPISDRQRRLLHRALVLPADMAEQRTCLIDFLEMNCSRPGSNLWLLLSQQHCSAGDFPLICSACGLNQAPDRCESAAGGSCVTQRQIGIRRHLNRIGAMPVACGQWDTEIADKTDPLTSTAFLFQRHTHPADSIPAISGGG
jgi:hypothetical protein